MNFADPTGYNLFTIAFPSPVLKRITAPLCPQIVFELRDCFLGSCMVGRACGGCVVSGCYSLTLALTKYSQIAQIYPFAFKLVATRAFFGRDACKAL